MTSNKYANLIIYASIYWIFSSVPLICSLYTISCSHHPFPGRQVLCWLVQKRQHTFPLDLTTFVCLPWPLLIWSLLTPLLLGFPFPHTMWFPFIWIPQDPGTDAHFALLGTTSWAFALGAVSIVYDSFSLNLAAPSEPQLPAHQSQMFSVFVPMSALLSAFLHARLWALTCWPTQEHDDLHFWSNYLIWGNYL